MGRVLYGGSAGTPVGLGVLKSPAVNERDVLDTKEGLPELCLMVSDPKGNLVYSSHESPRFGAGRSEYFAIRLGAQGMQAERKEGRRCGIAFLPFDASLGRRADLLAVPRRNGGSMQGIPSDPRPGRERPDAGNKL
jgi:hypothetical protein